MIEISKTLKCENVNYYAIQCNEYSYEEFEIEDGIEVRNHKDELFYGRLINITDDAIDILSDIDDITVFHINIKDIKFINDF